MPGVSLTPAGAGARRRRVMGEHNIRGARAIMCIKGKTRRAPKKKRKKYLQQGATRGKCPRTCTPVCTPGICGDDSCGGTCGCTDRTICVCGACEVCDIACTSGDSVACGEALYVAIASGGTILVCPGEYEGQFPLTEDVEIIGAGSGDNPATSTILVGADGLGSVVPVTIAVTARLASLRVTGGNGSLSNSGGVNINNAGADVSIEDCALVGNRGNYGGGVSVYRGAPAITGSDFSHNTAAHGGGIATATLSTIESTTITNTALGGAGTGGGIYQFSAGATINNAATVTNNNPDNCAGNSLIC
ncbi:MAG: hypothetical protein R2853_01495 [Thermomicrobiales bacterium]